MPRHTPPWVAIPPIPRLSAPVLATPCLAATRLAKLRLAYPEPAPPSFAAPCFALTRLSTTIHVEEFIVTYCTSDVSKGGWWYSESPMAWPVGDQFVEFLKRSEPGPGASAPDDEHGGDVKIKNKSIPNLPTGRLQRRLGVLHSQISPPPTCTASPNGLVRYRPACGSTTTFNCTKRSCAAGSPPASICSSTSRSNRKNASPPCGKRGSGCRPYGKNSSQRRLETTPPITRSSRRPARGRRRNTPPPGQAQRRAAARRRRAEAISGKQFRGGRRWRAVVADLGPAAKRAAGRRHEPVARFAVSSGAPVLVRADDHAPRFRLDAHDEVRLAHRNPNPLRWPIVNRSMPGCARRRGRRS